MLQRKSPARRGARLVACIAAALGSASCASPEAAALATAEPQARPEVVGWHLLALRSFDAVLTPDTKETAGLRPTEEPVQVAGILELRPEAPGLLQVSSEGKVLSAARLQPDPEGGWRVEAIAGGPPPPVRLASGALALLVPPGPLGRHTIVAEVAEVAGGKGWRREVLMASQPGNVGCLPLGHTFVYDVDLATGYLTKRLDAFEAGGLELAAEYCTHLFDQTTLGPGWTHTLEGVLYPDANPDLPEGTRRYLLVSASSSQVITCISAGCRNQAGYHGTAREVATAEGTEVVFRSLDGSEFRFGRPPGQALASPARLLSRIGPLGQTLDYVYDTSRAASVLTSVVDRVGLRQVDLQNTYVEGRATALLQQAELRASTAPAGSAPEKCVRYEHDERSRLTAIRRYAGPCDPAAEVPADRFWYADPPRPASALVRWIDAQQGETTVEYVTGELEGRRYLKAAEDVPRVKALTNPDKVRSEFTYDLRPMTIAHFGKPRRVWQTRVVQRTLGDEAAAPSTCLYRLDAAGPVARKIELVGPGRDEITTTEYDPVHVKVVRQLAAAGERTLSKIDDFGHTVERRTQSPGSTELAFEKWAFDPAFGVETCHVSADGTLTLTQLDSDGADPRRARPAGSGLPLRVTQYATPVPLEGAAGTASCSELATQVPEAAEDVITEHSYCGVRDGVCPAGARTGERVQTRQHARGADAIATARAGERP